MPESKPFANWETLEKPACPEREQVAGGKQEVQGRRAARGGKRGDGPSP